MGHYQRACRRSGCRGCGPRRGLCASMCRRAGDSRAQSDSFEGGTFGRRPRRLCSRQVLVVIRTAGSRSVGQYHESRHGGAARLGPGSGAFVCNSRRHRHRLSSFGDGSAAAGKRRRAPDGGWARYVAASGSAGLRSLVRPPSGRGRSLADSCGLGPRLSSQPCRRFRAGLYLVAVLCAAGTIDPRPALPISRTEAEESGPLAPSAVAPRSLERPANPPDRAFRRLISGRSIQSVASNAAFPTPTTSISLKRQIISKTEQSRPCLCALRPGT